MPRYALKLEYNGAPFHGWQRQAGGLKTVQGALEAALSRVDPTEPEAVGAGLSLIHISEPTRPY